MDSHTDDRRNEMDNSKLPRYATQHSALLALPYEILVDIFVTLGSEDVYSLLAASTTCRHLHALLYDDHRVWRGLALAQYDDPARACAFPHPQEVDWQARVLSRAIVTEILMNSRHVLGEASGQQHDLLCAKSTLIGDTLLGLYLDMPAHPADSRNAALLTQLLKREEFAYLALNRRGTTYDVLGILRQVLDGQMWDAEAAVDAESPWVKLWHLPPFEETCDRSGKVQWSAIRTIVSVLLWQFENGGGELDERRVDENLEAPLIGTGLGSEEDGADWAGVGGEWYVVAQPFLPWGDNVPLSEVGTFTVSPCTLNETLAGFTSHFGRSPTASEKALLDSPSNFTPYHEPIYFAGTNQATMPHLDDPPVDVNVRGVVRLSADNPPVAVWTWIIEGRERIVTRLVQMPGRGNAFFGRWKKEADPNADSDDGVEGAMWMMR